MSYYGTTINDSAVIVVKAGEEIPAPAFLAVGADGKVATAGKNAIGIVMPGCDDKVTVGDDLDVQIKDIGAWTAGAAVAYQSRPAHCCTDRKSRLQASRIINRRNKRL